MGMFNTSLAVTSLLFIGLILGLWLLALRTLEWFPKAAYKRVRF